MNAVQHLFEWLKEAALGHWLALMILVAPMIWVVYQADKAENILPMLPLPLVAFAVGVALRPRHVWLIWLGSVVIEWITVLAWGKYNEPGSGETLASIMIEAFIWMFFGVLIPVWLGRLVRALIAEGPPPAQTPEA